MHVELSERDASVVSFICFCKIINKAPESRRNIKGAAALQKNICYEADSDAEKELKYFFALFLNRHFSALNSKNT